jgi:Putative collagen-binding domain of a collagenase
MAGTRSGRTNHGPWGSKVDMNTWKEAYWTNLHHNIQAAQARHLIVGLTIWDGHTAFPGGKAGGYSFWNSDKNLQGVQWAYDADALVQYPHPSKRGNPSERLVYYQRRVVDKLLDEIKTFRNVIIELNNEDSHGASERWWLWWAKYFKDRGYVVAVNETAGGMGALSDATVAASPYVDAKFYHHRTDASLTASRYAMKKIIVADADTDCEDFEPDRSRRLAWQSVLRGGGWNDFVCMQQPFPNSVKTGFYGHLLHFFAARHIPFWDMLPMGNLSSSGYALAKPGDYYLVYADHDVAVDLSGASGPFQYLWYDPRAGIVVRTGKVSGGAKRSFTIPEANDYILWITAKDPASRHPRVNHR